MQGQLFSHDFLTRGILDTAPWHVFDQASLEVFSTELRQVYGVLAADSALNEAQTESELIEPVLALLGWDHLPQINLSESGREDVPDFLLFADAAAKARALAESADDRRARHGVCLVEAKRWLRVLDRNETQPGSTRKPRDFGAPSSVVSQFESLNLSEFFTIIKLYVKKAVFSWVGLIIAWVNIVGFCPIYVYTELMNTIQRLNCIKANAYIQWHK